MLHSELIWDISDYVKYNQTCSEMNVRYCLSTLTNAIYKICHLKLTMPNQKCQIILLVNIYSFLFNIYSFFKIKHSEKYFEEIFSKFPFFQWRECWWKFVLKSKLTQQIWRKSSFSFSLWYQNANRWKFCFDFPLQRYITSIIWWKCCRSSHSNFLFSYRLETWRNGKLRSKATNSIHQFKLTRCI